MTLRRNNVRRGGPLHDRFTRWHWGVKPGTEVHYTDTDYPDELVEIGRLMELHIEDGRGAYTIKVPERILDYGHLAFDPAHGRQRMYVIADPRVLRHVQSAARGRGTQKPHPLARIAQATGGSHQGAYPDVRARLLGVCRAVVYLTHKKGDGLSGYIHEMGEMGGTQPVVCQDGKGRLWFAGGDYTCPTPGITN